MDQAIRNKLRNVVTQCRKLLEEAVSQVLQGQFGIYPSGKKDEVHVEDEARMKNLSEEDKGYRRDILAHLEHIQALGYKPKDALAQLVREIAFTHLNRLCAYKMMEAKEVWIGGQRFREAVSRGLKSQGFQFYLADHSEDKKCFDSGHQDVAYRHFLAWLGALLSEEIGVLFSPTDPANRLFPPQRVLDDVLALVNSDDLKDIWSQDETIGWVYQYFTPRELRDQARKESQAPRNSYELAFRNQFFTPRYVVEFLTDNTLGRIWYEMRKADTKLKDQCRYLVRRPGEVFLAEGQSLPERTQNQDELSQEELPKQRVHIPFRSKKDPRELRILDPACGSGHFLLYCFDLLLTIYEEAYADPDLGPKLKEEYPTLDALRRDIPRLILAHNLHGIDIDLRCTQIAALALWLRCQRAFREMGLKQDRPKITRSNIVCAEPMPGEKEILKEFVAQLQPKILGHLVEIVFEKMKLAGEAGSLLTIEEELRDAIAEAKRQWAAEHEQATDRKGRPLLFSRAEMERIASKMPQPQLFDEMTDEQFWNEAEQRVLDALRGYASHAANGVKLQRQLFVEDAAQGFAFIHLCFLEYDVILMNPPFGVCSETTEPAMRSRWGSFANDIYVLFITIHTQRLVSAGSLGAITSRGFMIGRDQRDYRPTILGKGVATLDLLLDLGLDVLDTAAVETCAYVLRRYPHVLSQQEIIFFDLCSMDRNRLSELESLLRETAPMVRLAERFLAIPQSPLIYRATDEEITAFSKESSLDPAFGKVTKGLSSSCDERFIRLMWEVPAELIRKRWQFCAKGADYQWFLTNICAVVDWLDNGKLIRDFTATVSTNIAQAYRSSKYYYKSALTYTYRCNDFSLRALPKGCLFTNSAPVIVSKDQGNASTRYVELLCAFLSERYEGLLAHVSKKGKYDTGRMGKLPVPKVALDKSGMEHWDDLVAYLHRFESTLETSPYFTECCREFDKVPDYGTLCFRIRAFAECYRANVSDSFIDRASRGFVQRHEKDNGRAHALLSYLLGVAFGRWDMRYATQEREANSFEGAFADFQLIHRECC
jgi:hypothetical protein